MAAAACLPYIPDMISFFYCFVNLSVNFESCVNSARYPNSKIDGCNFAEDINKNCFKPSIPKVQCGDLHISEFLAYQASVKSIKYYLVFLQNFCCVCKTGQTVSSRRTSERDGCHSFLLLKLVQA